MFEAILADVKLIFLVDCLTRFYLAAWLPPRVVDISSMSLSIAFVCSSTHFGFGLAAPVSRSSSSSAVA